MRGKRGVELSFGVIFSIIVIIAIIAVAFYMISYFLKLKNCTEIGMFGRDFQDKINYAWNADSVSDVFTGILPGSVEKVCVGNLTNVPNTPAYSWLDRFEGSGANLFFYPVPTSCGIRSGKLEHAQFSRFDCAFTHDGKATFKLVKGSYDDSVFVCAGNASSCGT